MAPDGQELEIVEFAGGDRFVQRVNEMGLLVGKKIKIIQSTGAHGPAIIQVDNNKIALGQGMLEKIIVKPCSSLPSEQE